MSKIITTNSYEETQRFAEKLALTNKRKRIYALYGDLGSGKTTFVQGLARGFGIDKKIISPTFIIMRKYLINSKFPNYETFFHVDLYRIGSERDLEEIGLIELMQDANNFFVIEWPEKMGRMLPKERVNLYFEYIDENKRRIKID